MRNQSIRTMTTYAIFIALIFAMAFTPYLGYIMIGPLSLTTLPIPVILGGFMFGPLGGFIFGLTFGITSLIQAFTTPGALDVFFQNPLISVLPRALFGLAAGSLLYPIRKKLYFNKGALISLTAISTFVLVMFHSVVTLVMLALFNSDVWAAIAGILGSASLVEGAIAAVIVPSIIISLHKLLPRYIKVDQPQEKVEVRKVNLEE